MGNIATRQNGHPALPVLPNGGLQRIKGWPDMSIGDMLRIDPILLMASRSKLQIDMACLMMACRLRMSLPNQPILTIIFQSMLTKETTKATSPITIIEEELIQPEGGCTIIGGIGEGVGAMWLWWSWPLGPGAIGEGAGAMWSWPSSCAATNCTRIYCKLKKKLS